MATLEQVAGRQRTTGISGAGIALLAAIVVVGIATWVSFLLRNSSGTFATYWPLAVLGVSVGLVVTLITAVRVHAFVALIVSAMAVGFMARVGALPVPMGIMGKPSPLHWVRAIELTAEGFGGTAAKVGIVIVLAAIIGMCLLESGAADRVVRQFLRWFGERNGGLALLAATYVVSIPIFFDTIFMLLVPLAHAMYWRTKRDYLLYILAICCAGVITHSMVIPHPGPLAMATDLRIDPGLTIWVGLLTGIVPAICGWMAAKWINARMPVTPPEETRAAMESADSPVNRPDSELPPLWASVVPVLLPVALIGAASFLSAFGKDALPGLTAWMTFVGDRHVALLLGTAFAIWLVVRQCGWSLAQAGERIGPPLAMAGVVILITSAGGAFGGMLKNAGVGHAIKSAADGQGINMIVLAWLVAIVIRIAQGSATVAMLSTSSMMYPLMSAPGALGCHPVYIFLAIGYGAVGVSWMNDSGFWLVSRLGGFTEQQTLKSWTVLLFVISVAGLGTTLVMSMLIPGV